MRARRVVGWLAALAGATALAGCYLTHQREDDAGRVDAPVCPIAARLVVPAGSCAEIVVDTEDALWPCSDVPTRGSYVRIDNESARFTRVEVYSSSTDVTNQLCIAEADMACGACLETTCLVGPVRPGEGGVAIEAEERASFVVQIANDGEPTRVVACDLFP
jgi:hypothetical protein